MFAIAIVFLASNSLHLDTNQDFLHKKWYLGLQKVKKWLCTCYNTKNFEQIHWSKMFCRMYCLAAMLSVTTPTTSKNIATKFYSIDTNLLWFGTQFWVSNLFHFSQKSKSYFDITFQCIHFQKSLFSENKPWFWWLKSNLTKVKDLLLQVISFCHTFKAFRWQGFPFAIMTPI